MAMALVTLGGTDQLLVRARVNPAVGGDPYPPCTASVLTVMQAVSPLRPVSYPLVGVVKQVAWTLRAVRYCC